MRVRSPAHHGTTVRTAGSGAVCGGGCQCGGQGRLPVQRLSDAAAAVMVAAVVAAVDAVLPRAGGLVRVAPEVCHGVLEGAAAAARGALPTHRRAEQGVAVRVHGRVVVHAVMAAVAMSVRRRPGTDSDVSV